MTAAITDRPPDAAVSSTPQKPPRDLGWLGVPVTALAGLAAFWLFPGISAC